MKANMKTHFELPKAALSVMTLLEDKGFEVYLIGGYVRDLLIKRKSTDLDMATNASSKAMIEIFKDYPLSLIGEKLGTVGVKIEDTWVELTTYRSESTSSNFRHPDEVRFIGSLKDDVLRRDFTINALALNIYGDLIDYTDGLEDLKNKKIRAIGHPEDRFAEDALRILRALRFSAQLGFTIDEETEKAMRTHAVLINCLPIERIASELDKLIMAKQAGAVLQRYSDLISPYLQVDLTHLDQLELMIDPAFRYLCLLEPDSSDQIQEKLSRLKLSKPLIKKVIDLKVLTQFKTKDRFKMKALMNQYGSSLVSMSVGYNLVMERERIDPRVYLSLLEENVVVNLKGLAIKGDDLIALGYFGKQIKVLLSQLLDLVMSEKIQNNKEALIQALKKLH
jgi:tRNA nucleotidyltransferase (CCA-adding enzyme)